jgi:hypothetical protein
MSVGSRASRVLAYRAFSRFLAKDFYAKTTDMRWPTRGLVAWAHKSFRLERSLPPAASNTVEPKVSGDTDLEVRFKCGKCLLACIQIVHGSLTGNDARREKRLALIMRSGCREALLQGIQHNPFGALCARDGAGSASLDMHDCAICNQEAEQHDQANMESSSHDVVSIVFLSEYCEPTLTEVGTSPKQSVLTGSKSHSFVRLHKRANSLPDFYPTRSRVWQNTAHLFSAAVQKSRSGFILVYP